MSTGGGARPYERVVPATDGERVHGRDGTGCAGAD